MIFRVKCLLRNPITQMIFFNQGIIITFFCVCMTGNSLNETLNLKTLDLSANQIASLKVCFMITVASNEIFFLDQ